VRRDNETRTPPKTKRDGQELEKWGREGKQSQNDLTFRKGGADQIKNAKWRGEILAKEKWWRTPQRCVKRYNV